MTPLAQKLATLSAREMVSALGAGQAPSYVKQGLAVPFFALSRALGVTLSELDDDIAAFGLPAAAGHALGRFGVALRVSGSAPPSGPCVVLANHPGAYDALALMSALERKDLLILAADRVFLRALPQLAPHLAFVGQSPGARAGALKRAVSCLARGGAVLHFPAGEIEPDADFEPDASRLLKPWQPGVSALLRACATVDGSLVTAGVRGVHSPRAKRWLLNRVAERRGVTTLAPLLQMLRHLTDVVTRVRLVDVAGARALAQQPSDAWQPQLRSGLRQAIVDA